MEQHVTSFPNVGQSIIKSNHLNSFNPDAWKSMLRDTLRPTSSIFGAAVTAASSIWVNLGNNFAAFAKHHMYNCYPLFLCIQRDSWIKLLQVGPRKTLHRISCGHTCFHFPSWLIFMLFQVSSCCFSISGYVSCHYVNCFCVSNCVHVCSHCVFFLQWRCFEGLWLGGNFWLNRFRIRKCAGGIKLRFAAPPIENGESSDWK